jgi:hypothetical protein
MQKIWLEVGIWHQNPYWKSPIISSMHGVYVSRRILHKILHAINKTEIPQQSLQPVLLPFFINRYNNRLLPLLWQFFLIPNRINTFVDLECNASLPAWIISAGLWWKTGDLYHSNFPITICFTSLTPHTIESQLKLIFLPIQNTVEICKYITILILHQFWFGLSDNPLLWSKTFH